jgi:hypothetical protein
MIWEKVIVEYLLLDVGINLYTISVVISLQSLTKLQSLSRFSRIIEKLDERVVGATSRSRIAMNVRAAA